MQEKPESGEQVGRRRLWVAEEGPHRDWRPVRRGRRDCKGTEEKEGTETKEPERSGRRKKETQT